MTKVMIEEKDMRRVWWRLNPRYVFVGVCFVIVSLYCTGFCPFPPSSYQQSGKHNNKQTYVSKYPLTDAQWIPNGRIYKLAIIADLDEERSKSPNKKFEWRSYLKTGYLTAYTNGNYKVKFTKTETLTTNLNEKGRGLELSELCTYNGKLYTVDDRTGVVFEIIDGKPGKPIPWVILMDGNGKNKKGFKSEWMTVKDGVLYIGSMGKEWTNSNGDFLNFNPMFVKSIAPDGAVMHHNWTDHYIAIRSKLGITNLGYVLHEAVTWSPKKQKWYFLPRRMSAQKYDEMADETRCTNVLISASADFAKLNVIYVGKLDVTHGFSSFKFIPGTNDDVAIALKTKEVQGNVSSYVTIFEVNTGRVVMPEQLIAMDKYEGIEFL